MADWKVSLEFEEGGSKKFWRARVEGATLYVNYGRIGTQGQTQVKELASADAAKKEIEKLEREKRKKGYEDTAGVKEENQGLEGGEEKESGEAEEKASRRVEKKPDDTNKDTVQNSAKLSASFSMTKHGRKIEVMLTCDGKTVRMDSIETYSSPDLARNAFDRLKSKLVEEGYIVG